MAHPTVRRGDSLGRVIQREPHSSTQVAMLSIHTHHRKGNTQFALSSTAQLVGALGQILVDFHLIGEELRSTHDVIAGEACARVCEGPIYFPDQVQESLVYRSTYP